MPAVRRIRKFVEVPSTWEGWVMRVMTVSVVIMIIAVVFLLQIVIGLRDYIQDARHERNAFQVEQSARQCEILRQLSTSVQVMKDLQC